MDTSCYLWNESDANKGSCEVASCLLMYLTAKKQQGQYSTILFSDICGGQNCNRMVVVMLSHALRKLDLEELTLNFFVTGHSQNENDSAHSVIESAVSKMTIFATAQWETDILQETSGYCSCCPA